MSSRANTELFERAAQAIDDWEGTPLARAIERDLEAGDLDQLYAHVCVAEALESQEQFNNYEVYG